MCAVVLAVLNMLRLLVTDRFIRSLNEMQPFPIQIWTYHSDSCAISQTCLLTISLFSLRMMWRLYRNSFQFIGASGTVLLDVEWSGEVQQLHDDQHKERMERVALLRQVAASHRAAKLVKEPQLWNEHDTMIATITETIRYALCTCTGSRC
jgi:hypothetical protein